MIQESRAWLFAVLNSINDGIIATDAKGRVNFMNPSAEAITGWSRDAALGQDLSAVFHIIDEKTVTHLGNLVSEAIQKGKVNNSYDHLRLIDRRGTKRSIIRTVAPIKNGRGSIIGAVITFRDISERKQAEGVLQESEEKYRTLIEQSDDAIYLLHAGRFEVINRKFQEWFGITEDDINNPDFIFKSILAPRSRRLVQEFKEWTSEGVRHRLLPRYEFVALDKDGREIEVELTVSYPTYKDGLASQGVLRDITERKKIERERETLLENEREQRILAETLGEVFLALTAHISREAVLDEILHQMQRVVSYDAANIALLEQDSLYTARWQGYQAFGSEQLMSNLRQMLADFPLDARVVQSVQPLVISDTRETPEWVTIPESIWIRSAVVVPICLHRQTLGLLRVDSGTPHKFTTSDVDHLQPLANAAAIALENARLYAQARQEIKERVQAEQELRQLTARNQAILDAMPDSLFYLNREGELLDYRVNKESLWPGVLNGSADSGELGSILPADLVDLILEYVEPALTSGKIQFFEHHMSSPLGVQDFEVRLVASDANEVLVIVRNITERKRAEQQAIRNERLAALGQLAAALAHEISNPLQAIQSHLDLILGIPLEATETQEFLQIIDHEMGRLNDIWQRVLKFVYPGPAQRQPVSVIKLLQEVLKLTRKQLEHKRIQVSTDFRSVPDILAGSGELNQVFLNLVLNASEVQFADQGRLHLAVYPDGEDVAISFTNNGPIIPAEVLPHIFEPFFTTKPDGSGLGLWVCYTLVNNLGGSLSVENLGERDGVTFTVKLPVGP